MPGFFWDTQMGHRLADTLIHYLPKLTEKQDKQQKIVVYSPNDEHSLEDVLNEHIKNGWTFVNSMRENNKYVIVFEKGENA